MTDWRSILGVWCLLAVGVALGHWRFKKVTRDHSTPEPATPVLEHGGSVEGPGVRSEACIAPPRRPAGRETAWRDRDGDVWTLGTDGLLHSPETRPFVQSYVEKKWGPLVPIDGSVRP